MQTKHHPPHIPDMLLAASPLVLAVVLYGFTVGLPFFRDDLIIVPLLERVSVLDVWLRPSGIFDFYRPSAFTAWKLLSRFGGPDPALFHWVNVLAFGMCGVLAGQAVRAVGLRSRWAAAAIGWMVILWPFRFAAVVWVWAVFHGVGGVGLLMCLVGLLRYVRGAGAGWLLVAYGSAFVGVFSLESGFVLAGLASVFAVLVGKWRRRAVLAAIPAASIAGLYLIAWASLPDDSGGLDIPDAVLPRVMNLAQGLAYPLGAALARVTPPITPTEQHSLIALTLLGPLAALVLLRGRARWLGLGAVLWYVLAALPSALLLTTDYVLGAPRLSFLASIGAAAMWGAVAVDGRWRLVRWLGCGYILAAVIVGGVFLRAKRADFIRLADYSRALMTYQETLTATDAPRTMLMNAPFGLVPYERTFLSGAEGALIMQRQFHYNNFVAVNARVPSGEGIFASTRFTGHLLQQREDAFFTPFGAEEVSGAALYEDLLETDRVLMTDFIGDGDFVAVMTGGVLRERPESEPRVTFDDGRVMLYDARATITSSHSTWTNSFTASGVACHHVRSTSRLPFALIVARASYNITRPSSN
ncbi:MAG: hypothetical protein AAF125_17015, partial [Chloroflexota bacterium]